MANKYNIIQRNTINIFLFVNVSLNFKYNPVSMLFEQFFWVPSLKKPFFKVYDMFIEIIFVRIYSWQSNYILLTRFMLVVTFCTPWKQGV